METTGSGPVDRIPVVPTINVTICSGCGRCVAACPKKIITLETVRFRKNAIILYPERCNFCGRCEETCPIDAIITG